MNIDSIDKLLKDQCRYDLKMKTWTHRHDSIDPWSLSITSRLSIESTPVFELFVEWFSFFPRSTHVYRSRTLQISCLGWLKITFQKGFFLNEELMLKFLFHTPHFFLLDGDCIFIHWLLCFENNLLIFEVWFYCCFYFHFWQMCYTFVIHICFKT